MWQLSFISFNNNCQSYDILIEFKIHCNRTISEDDFKKMKQNMKLFLAVNRGKFQ